MTIANAATSPPSVKLLLIPLFLLFVLLPHPHLVTIITGYYQSEDFVNENGVVESKKCSVKERACGRTFLAKSEHSDQSFRRIHIVFERWSQGLITAKRSQSSESSDSFTDSCKLPLNPRYEGGILGFYSLRNCPRRICLDAFGVFGDSTPSLDSIVFVLILEGVKAGSKVSCYFRRKFWNPEIRQRGKRVSMEIKWVTRTQWAWRLDEIAGCSPPFQRGRALYNLL